MEYVRRVAEYKGRVMEYADRDAKHEARAGFRRVVRRSIGGFRGHLEIGTPAFRGNAGVFCDMKRARTRRKRLFAPLAKKQDAGDNTAKRNEQRGGRGGGSRIEMK